MHLFVHYALIIITVYINVTNPTIIELKRLTENPASIDLNASLERIFLFSGHNADIPEIHIPILDILANPARDTDKINPVL